MIRGKLKDYLDRRPNASDEGLLIEMTDEILKNDVKRKCAAYASVGIPAYRVLNLADNQIHVFETPLVREVRYASIATFKPGQSLRFTLDGVQVGPIAASDLLPAR